MGVSAKTNRDRYSEDNWKNSNESRNSTGTTNSNTASNTNSQSNDVLNSLSRSATTSANATSGSTSADFSSPEAQALLRSLTGGATSGNGQRYTDQAAGAFGSLASGKVSPYTEDIIKNSNVEADRNFAGRLAQTRAGAYRGGTAANIGKQGQLAANFSAQQGAENAKLRDSAFQSAQGNAAIGATGLASLGTQQQGLGTQLLALLRGEKVAGSTVGSQATDASQQQNNQSNTNSNTSSSTQTTQQMLETIIAALTGGSSGTKSGTSAGGGFGVNYG